MADGESVTLFHLSLRSGGSSFEPASDWVATGRTPAGFIPWFLNC